MLSSDAALPELPADPAGQAPPPEQIIPGGPDGDDVPIDMLRRMISSGVRGDVNGDGALDAVDLQDVLSNINTTDAVADLNGDGTVDQRDVQWLLVIMNGGDPTA